MSFAEVSNTKMKPFGKTHENLSHCRAAKAPSLLSSNVWTYTPARYVSKDVKYGGVCTQVSKSLILAKIESGPYIISLVSFLY